MHGSKVFQQQLKCQDIQPYIFIKPVKKPDLPTNYCVKGELVTVSPEKHINDCTCMLVIETGREGLIGSKNAIIERFLFGFFTGSIE